MLNLSSKCQKNDMKFGKIKIDNLNMTVYEKDTSASAVVLGDYGKVFFKYNKSDGNWYLNFERNRRIKIIKKNGYKWADHEISLYDHGNISENVSAIKGFTYNLVDGKIEKEKLTKKSQFREEVSKYYKAVKFTMPNVREGSIIEYSYNITSDYFFQFPTWQFQYSIPVIKSELVVEIPEYFRYKNLMKGYEQLAINERTTGSGFITFTNSDGEGGYTNDNIQYQTEKYRMVVLNCPAFIEEPMITTANNYRAAIEFELAVVQMPNSRIRNYTATWESINKSLLDNENFGGQLKAGVFLNKDVEQINLGFEQPLDKMHAVYKFVQNHMKWNNSNSKYVNTTLRSAYNDKSGSSGDINLLLTLMLRKVGLDANPVILSTRSNGIINPEYPMQTQFNYVIAYVIIDRKGYLLDATDPLCPSNLLPIRCLNGNGRIISEKRTDWVKLNPNRSYDYDCSANLELDQDGQIKGTMVIDRKDYAAYRLRKGLESEKSEEKFIESLENANNGLTIDNFAHTNIDSIYMPTKEEYEITIEDRARVASDFIYINPMLFEQIESNPFKLQERKYPVDYSYPKHEKYSLTLSIPDGYMVEEVPEPLQLALPDNSANFKFEINFNEKEIELQNYFAINKSVFLYYDYAGLKDFYNKVVEKQAEQIILKQIQE